MIRDKVCHPEHPVDLTWLDDEIAEALLQKAIQIKELEEHRDKIFSLYKTDENFFLEKLKQKEVEIERLKEDIKQLIAPHEVGGGIVNAKQQEIKSLQEKLRVAREALKKYGFHRHDELVCGASSGGECVCGLNKALQQIGEV